MHRLHGWQLIVMAGPMIWPILACSIASCAIALERLLYFRKIRIDTGQLVAELIDKVKHSQVREALELCSAIRHPVAEILKAGILRYDLPRSQIKDAVEAASLNEVPKLERNVALLPALSNAAILMGILGTVIGMIHSFHGLQAQASLAGFTAIPETAAGLWESLLSTAAGLAAAIPAFIAYSYFSFKINEIVREMEKSASDLVTSLTG